MKALLVLSLLISGNVLAQQYPPGSFPPGSYPVYPQPVYPVPSGRPVKVAEPAPEVRVPKVVTWPKSLEESDIPDIIRRNEILREFYVNFVKNTSVPDKKSLRVGDKKSKYKCVVHTFNSKDQDFDQDEFKVRFDSMVGGLNAVEMRKTNMEKETGENYVISMAKDFGWRGMSKKANKMVEMLPDLKKEFFDQSYRSPVASNWSGGGKIEVKSASMRIFDTVCVRGMKASADEPINDLVIELGQRFDVEIKDSEGNVLPNSSRVALMTANEQVPRELTNFSFPSAANPWFKKYLPKGTLKSVCWADRDEENKEGYKLTGIAVCSLETDE